MNLLSKKEAGDRVGLHPESVMRLARNGHLRIPMIAAGDSDGSRSPIPRQRGHFSLGSFLGGMIAAGLVLMSFSLVLVKRRVGCFLGLELAHGLALEFEVVGVVDDSVEDGIGEGGIADDLVPLV